MEQHPPRGPSPTPHHGSPPSHIELTNWTLGTPVSRIPNPLLSFRDPSVTFLGYSHRRGFGVDSYRPPLRT